MDAENKVWKWLSSQYRPGKYDPIVIKIWSRLKAFLALQNWKEYKPAQHDAPILKGLKRIGVACLLLGLFWILICVPKIQMQSFDPASNLPVKERADMEDNFRKTIVQIYAGLAVLYGFYWTSRRIRASEDQVRVSQEQVATSQKQVAALEDGQITERYTKAIEQLGCDNMAIRLGGIYALERIANDCNIEEKNDYWTVMEVLTAFLRENYQVVPSIVDSLDEQDHKNQKESSNSPFRTDLLAIVEVLRRRVHYYGNGESNSLDLSRTNLCGSKLSKAKLIKANLSKADLSNADLRGVDLSLADLRWTDFKAADFSDAVFFGAQLCGGDLRGSNLCGANLSNTDLYMATSYKAELTWEDLKRTDLRWNDRVMTNRNWSNLNWINLNNATYNSRTKFPDGFNPETNGLKLIK